MKKIAFYLVGAAAMFAACDKDEEIFGTPEEGILSGEEAVVEGYYHELTASVANENENPASRAGFDLTDGAFHWLAGDDISVTNENGQFTKYTLKTGAGTASATFQTDGQIGTPQGYALHPYSAGHNVDGAALTFNLPAVYTYTHTADEYGAAPMVAEFEANAENLQFKHVGGAFCFQMAGLPAGTAWFKFEANKQITGTFGVTEEDGNQIIKLNGGAASSVTINIPTSAEARDLTFYIPVPTGTYTGFTISVGNASETTWSYTSAATNTVNRKSLKKMPKVNLSASTAEAVADVFTNGGILTLADDVTLEETEALTIPKGKSVVLDLNGHSISQTSTTPKSMIVNNGDLTITGDEETDKIAFTFNGTVNNGIAANAIDNRGVLVIKGGEISNTTTTGSSQIGYAINNYNGSTLTVDGGTIKAVGGFSYDGIRLFCGSNQTTVTVNNGTISSIWAQNPTANKATEVKGSVIINGGTVGTTYYENYTTVKVKNGVTATVSAYGAGSDNTTTATEGDYTVYSFVH